MRMVKREYETKSKNLEKKENHWKTP